MTRLVTCFDVNYASRAAIMVTSAQEFDLRSVSVLALDEAAVAASEKLGVGKITRKDDFLHESDFLRSALEGRSRAEHIFTIGPSFLEREMEQIQAGEWLVYCDADIVFYGSVNDYLRRASNYSVVVTPHRHYWWNRARLRKYGEFNVGLVAFRNDVDGRAALRYWSKSCIDWCFDRPEDSKYADQKYLENFSEISSRVFIDENPGANLAPWNSMGRNLTQADNGEIFVQGTKLWFFHAQGIKSWRGGYILGNLRYLSLASKRLLELVYRPYLKDLRLWSERLQVPDNSSSRKSSSRIKLALDLLEKIFSVVLFQYVKVPSQEERSRK